MFHLQDGDTPLHDAARGGHDGTVKVLLQFKADANITNKVKQGYLYDRHHVVDTTFSG